MIFSADQVHPPKLPVLHLSASGSHWLLATLDLLAKHHSCLHEGFPELRQLHSKKACANRAVSQHSLDGWYGISQN